MEAFTLDNPVFRTYVIAAALAILKMLFHAFLVVRRMMGANGGYAWALSDLEPDIAALLAPVIWAAGDLLIEPARIKVRRCANDECVWLFLDDSKSGTRRWCDMKACGNRAKAHRHYAKLKKQAKKK